MIKPLPLGIEEEFVSQFDKGGNPTKWRIGCVDSFLTMFCFQSTDSGNKNGFDLNATINMVRFGLKGVENFGAPIAFETVIVAGMEFQAVSLDFIKKIPSQVLSELGGKIAQFQVPSDELAKN